MQTDLITAVTTWITGMLTWVIDSVTGIIPIFYDSTQTTGSKITFIGYLGLFGLAVGMVKLGINFVAGFFIK